ncbi:MAG TPA: hypothetical protein VGC41_16360, partial [Kofleriaceae bacterium]
MRELRLGVPCNQFLRTCRLLIDDTTILPSTFMSLGRLPELEYLEISIGESELPMSGFEKLM